MLDRSSTGDVRRGRRADRVTVGGAHAGLAKYPNWEGQWVTINPARRPGQSSSIPTSRAERPSTLR